MYLQPVLSIPRKLLVRGSWFIVCVDCSRFTATELYFTDFIDHVWDPVFDAVFGKEKYAVGHEFLDKFWSVGDKEHTAFVAFECI